MKSQKKLMITILLISFVLSLAIPYLSAKPKWIEELTLQYYDQTTWHTMDGSLQRGFILEIDPSLGHTEYYFIDIENIDPWPDYSDVDSYPFYLKATPKGRFLKYWAEWGVTEDATGHQGHLWKIINGEEPIFYLISGALDVWLIDGFHYDFLGEETSLRVNADYPTGVYHFVGTVFIGGMPYETMIRIFITN